MSDPTFTFGPPAFTVWFDEPHEPVLHVLLWFKTANGGNCSKEMTLENPRPKTRDQALEYVLRWVTPFVRERWFLIEVSTPQRNHYGRIEGGHGRLRVTRTVEPA